MATELISNRGENTYTQGELNWLVGGWVIGNPQQDNIDQEAANVAETFLGISHMNCLLCHNGRGHLDALSLWGKEHGENAGLGLRFFPVARDNGQGSGRRRRQQSALLLGRARRFASRSSGLHAGHNHRQSARAYADRNHAYGAPAYPFTGETPKPGENYRVALARIVTSDIQFARATVNYIWKEFFGRGIVDPVNQFDPARLDPDNPPPDPWTLQPSNARLLNALAQEFVDSGFDLKALMRKIANSEAYQLSSRYNGEWKPSYEPLFARKLVRRLWAEEIHDAVAQSSGVSPATISPTSAHLRRPRHTSDIRYLGLSSGPCSFRM